MASRGNQMRKRSVGSASDQFRFIPFLTSEPNIKLCLNNSENHHLFLIFRSESCVAKPLWQRIYFIGKLCGLNFPVCLLINIHAETVTHSGIDHLLGWPVPNYDWLHLYLKWFHPYFVLFIELVAKRCTVLKRKKHEWMGKKIVAFCLAGK